MSRGKCFNLCEPGKMFYRVNNGCFIVWTGEGVLSREQGKVFYRVNREGVLSCEQGSVLSCEQEKVFYRRGRCFIVPYLLRLGTSVLLLHCFVRKTALISRLFRQARGTEDLYRLTWILAWFVWGGGGGNWFFSKTDVYLGAGKLER